MHTKCIAPPGNHNAIFQTETSFSSVESKAQAAFQYFLDEVEQDAILNHQEQHGKILEFKILADNLSRKAASYPMGLKTLKWMDILQVTKKLSSGCKT